MKILFVVAVALCLAAADGARLNATVEAVSNRTRANHTSAQPEEYYNYWDKEARGTWTEAIEKLVPHVLPFARPFTPNNFNFFGRALLPSISAIKQTRHLFLYKPRRSTADWDTDTPAVPCNSETCTGYQPHVPGSWTDRQFPTAPWVDVPSRAGTRPTYTLLSVPRH